MKAKYMGLDRVMAEVEQAVGYMSEQLTKEEIYSVAKLVYDHYDRGFTDGYYQYRNELKALLDTKEREDSFFVKSEIKRQMKGLNSNNGRD